MSDGILCLGKQQNFSVEINPNVIIHILEAYYRNQVTTTKKTIGTILGVIQSDKINITNCFTVPLTKENEIEENDSIQELIDPKLKYHRSMFELNRQIYPEEVVIGGFVTNSESLIMDIEDLVAAYSASKISYFNPASHLQSPIILSLDPKSISNKFDIKTHMYVKSLEHLNTMGVFPVKEIKNQVNFQYKDKLTEVAPLVFKQDKKKDFCVVDTTNTQSVVQDTIDSLKIIQDRVKDIISGKIPNDEKFGQQVKQLLSLSSKLSEEQFDIQLEKQQQDAALLLFVSNLAKTQNTISDKINVINNN